MRRITPEQRRRSLLWPAFDELLADHPFVRRGRRRLGILSTLAALTVLIAHHLVASSVGVPSTSSLLGHLAPDIVGGRIASILVVIALWQVFLHAALSSSMRGWRDALLEDLRMANIPLGAVLTPLARSAVWGTLFGMGIGLALFDQSDPGFFRGIYGGAYTAAPLGRIIHSFLLALLVVPSAIMLLIFAVWSSMLATLQTDGVGRFAWRQFRYLSMAGLRAGFGILGAGGLLKLITRLTKKLVGSWWSPVSLVFAIVLYPIMVWAFLRDSFEKADKELDLLSQEVGEV